VEGAYDPVILLLIQQTKEIVNKFRIIHSFFPQGNYDINLGAFAKLQKVTASLVMCPSVCLPFCPSIRPFVRPRGTARLPQRIFTKFDI
jgi:hypothetical protein